MCHWPVPLRPGRIRTRRTIPTIPPLNFHGSRRGARASDLNAMTRKAVEPRLGMAPGCCAPALPAGSARAEPLPQYRSGRSEMCVGGCQAAKRHSAHPTAPSGEGDVTRHVRGAVPPASPPRGGEGGHAADPAFQGPPAQLRRAHPCRPGPPFRRRRRPTGDNGAAAATGAGDCSADRIALCRLPLPGSGSAPPPKPLAVRRRSASAAQNNVALPPRVDLRSRAWPLAPGPRPNGINQSGVKFILLVC
jgi:hypothetical protein